MIPSHAPNIKIAQSALGAVGWGLMSRGGLCGQGSGAQLGPLDLQQVKLPGVQDPKSPARVH